MVATPEEILLSRSLNERRVIALSEGTDPRVVAGGIAARDRGLADVVLVGDANAIEAELATQGTDAKNGLVVADPKTSDLIEEAAAEYHRLRQHRGVDDAAARQAAEDPLTFAALMVRLGHADGTVGGAVNTTSDVVRTAIQVIGTAAGAKSVSSFFLMLPPDNAPKGARAMLYADCGLVIDPNAEELAEVAKASATSYRAFLPGDPKVAMLSFSTRGSARHAHVTKVQEAVAALGEMDVDFDFDGELQFDAAFVPEIAERKASDSSVAGKANVMIFPDLDAGNIAYKITQRVAGYAALGPILQGLAKPANDLSRGCTAEDVTQLIAVTALQSLL